MTTRTITALLASAACLVASSTAQAAEIASPLFWKTAVRSKPDGPAVSRIFAATRSGEHNGFLVLDGREVEGKRWLAVRIGKRPNDRIGWVPARRFEVVPAESRLVISVPERTMTLYLGEKRAWRTLVVVGKPSTPTPRGLFAVHDFYRVDDDLRPWIVETTAHSEVLKRFLGGPARVAIHGRHGALRVPWGIAASNGCIRTPDWALRSIRKHLIPGSPIEIR